MPRRRHRQPNRPHEIEKSQLERADEVKRELQANGFQISGIQFWKKNKLSDAIRKLIGPYQAEADSYDSYHSLVGFACAARNASLAEESQRSKMVEDFLKAMLKRGAPRAAKAELRKFIDELIQRKLKLFPKDTRLIAHFELEDRGDDFYLSVASVLPSEN